MSAFLSFMGVFPFALPLVYIAQISLNSAENRRFSVARNILYQILLIFRNMNIVFSMAIAAFTMTLSSTFRSVLSSASWANFSVSSAFYEKGLQIFRIKLCCTLCNFDFSLILSDRYLLVITYFVLVWLLKSCKELRKITLFKSAKSCFLNFSLSDSINVIYTRAF